MNRPLQFLAAGLVIGSLHAAEPKADQKALADAFAEAVIASEFVWDEQGNLTHLAISNHTGTPRGKSGNKGAPGISGELFQKITGFPELKAVAIEMQPLADEDYQVLGQMKKLTDVRLQYIKKNGKGTGDTPRFINDLPLPLEILEIKHNFGIDDGNMNELKPQPELRKLEIDTGWANSEAVAFIKNSPKIENLQIHRTQMTDEDLQQVFAAVPELKFVEIRPNAQNKNGDKKITGRSLRGLVNNPKLEALSINLQWSEIPFEGGLDALVGLKNLRHVMLSPSDMKGFSIDDPAVQKLHKARPDIRLSVGRKTIGGPEDFTPVNKDDGEWNWDKGVNTHG